MRPRTRDAARVGKQKGEVRCDAGMGDVRKYEGQGSLIPREVSGSNGELP